MATMAKEKINALMQLDEQTNRVLNLVKAQYGLKDKGEAVAFVVHRYVGNKDEPALRPEFIEKMNNVKAQKSIAVTEFDKRYFP